MVVTSLIRIALYIGAATIANSVGWVAWDESTGQLAVNVEYLLSESGLQTTAAAGAVGAGTLAWWAKEIRSRI